MILTYIFHSGFCLEMEHSILVFDCWLDPAEVMPQKLQIQKPMYVFSSHFHEDHFTKDIFSWKSFKSDITYILSKDILKHRRAKKEDADAWLAKGAVWQDEHLKVTATGSNDSGVSWIVETEGRTIFHAGDLNNWYARFLTDDYQGGNIISQEFGEVNPGREEKLLLGELKDIQKITNHFDLVMFPVDGRIGNGYTRGARQFIERFKVGLLVPMHFAASGFESAWRMMEFTKPAHIPFWCISERGESIECHPLQPFLPRNGKILFLGSFPPQKKRWSCIFFYPNFINDHWRLEGEIFYGDRQHFVDEAHKCFKLSEIQAHCQEKGIAFFDTATAVRRLKDNASDKFLEVVVPTEIEGLIQQMPVCRAIIVTGEKAAQTVCETLGIDQCPAVGQAVQIPGLYNQKGQLIELYRLPSSSRAYPLAFVKKTDAYRQMFQCYLA